MADRIPVKAIYTGSDVTSLGELTSSDTINGSYITDNTIDEANLKISNTPTNGYVLTAQSGATGGLTWAADSTTDSTKLPLAGGTLTGNLSLGDNVKAQFGAGNDLQIYHDSLNSYIAEPSGTGSLKIRANNLYLDNGDGSINYIICTNGGAVDLYHNNIRKLITTSTGITVTGTAVATTSTDATNTGSVTLDFAANQNFVLTLTGNVTLANPTTEQVGQSGFIAFIQDGTGSRTVGLGTDYETAGAAGLTLTATASATDLVPYLVVASGRILLGTPQLAFA